MPGPIDKAKNFFHDVAEERDRRIRKEQERNHKARRASVDRREGSTFRRRSQQPPVSPSEGTSTILAQEQSRKLKRDKSDKRKEQKGERSKERHRSEYSGNRAKVDRGEARQFREEGVRQRDEDEERGRKTHRRSEIKEMIRRAEMEDEDPYDEVDRLMDQRAEQRAFNVKVSAKLEDHQRQKERSKSRRGKLDPEAGQRAKDEYLSRRESDRRNAEKVKDRNKVLRRREAAEMQFQEDHRRARSAQRPKTSAERQITREMEAYVQKKEAERKHRNSTDGVHGLTSLCRKLSVRNRSHSAEPSGHREATYRRPRYQAPPEQGVRFGGVETIRRRHSSTGPSGHVPSRRNSYHKKSGEERRSSSSRPESRSRAGPSGHRQRSVSREPQGRSGHDKSQPKKKHHRHHDDDRGR